MKRHAMAKLVSWKNKVNRMPLIIEGARQVGKTWLAQEFGKTQYSNTVYINFDISIKAREIFQKDIDPHNIINNLELLSASKIDPHNNLIIFDEIQECPGALSCLKYFYEQVPEYNIIAVSSLLGVAMHGCSSFPVDKVETLRLYPLNFSEFLEAMGETRYKQALTNKDYSIFTVIKDDLTSKLKLYYFIGGMPKAVFSYIQQQNMQEVRSIQEDIIANYQKDFSKHTNSTSIPKVGMIWNAIPAQLAKEKKQWVYKNLKKGARVSRYEDALHWLEQIGLVYRINRVRVNNTETPLSNYQKTAFKLYMLDVGLLSAKAGLTIQNLVDTNQEFFGHFKEALTEQYVLQELTSMEVESQIFYWSNDRPKGKSDVDFIIQIDKKIIPVVARSSINSQSKNLKAFIDYYKPDIAVRTSLTRYNKSKTIYAIPLYLIGQLASITMQKE